MNDNPTTAASVMAQFNAALTSIQNLDDELDTKVAAIEQKAFDDGNRPFTATETPARDQFRAGQKECDDARVALSAATLAALGNSDEVRALLAKVNATNNLLGRDLERLKRYKELAQTVANVAKGLADIAAGLVKLLP